MMSHITRCTQKCPVDSAHSNTRANLTGSGSNGAKASPPYKATVWRVVQDLRHPKIWLSMIIFKKRQEAWTKGHWSVSTVIPFCILCILVLVGIHLTLEEAILHVAVLLQWELTDSKQLMAWAIHQVHPFKALWTCLNPGIACGTCKRWRALDSTCRWTYSWVWYTFCARNCLSP